MMASPKIYFSAHCVFISATTVRCLTIAAGGELFQQHISDIMFFQADNDVELRENSS